MLQAISKYTLKGVSYTGRIIATGLALAATGAICKLLWKCLLFGWKLF